MILTLLLLLRNSAAGAVVNVDFAGALFAESFINAVAEIVGALVPPSTIDVSGASACESFLTVQAETLGSLVPPSTVDVSGTVAAESFLSGVAEVT